MSFTNSNNIASVNQFKAPRCRYHFGRGPHLGELCSNPAADDNTYCNMHKPFVRTVNAPTLPSITDSQLGLDKITKMVDSTLVNKKKMAENLKLSDDLFMGVCVSATPRS